MSKGNLSPNKRQAVVAVIAGAALTVLPAFAVKTRAQNAVLPGPLTVPVPKPSAAAAPYPQDAVPAGSGENHASTPSKKEEKKEQFAEIPPRTTQPRPRRIPIEVEPASGRVQVVEDSWVFVEPAEWSKHVARVHAPDYVLVIGTTPGYVRVRLKDGQVGFVPVSSVALTVPARRIFAVLHNSPVYEEPNRRSRQVARVYTPGKVRIVGNALGYLKVRMRSGVEGYIPVDTCE